MDRPTIDFMDPEFVALFDSAVGGLKRILRTTGDVFLYTASGHGAWEATIINLFSPGDAVLVVETGYFSENWTQVAASHGLAVHHVKADRRRGVDYADITAALRATPGIAGVLCVHNETATGLALDPGAVRAAIDAAGSPALLLVDTISSLGSLDFRFDDWGIDAAVGGSQKGLMLPTGFSFHRRFGPRPGRARQGQAAALLFRLDDHAGPPAPQLRRHGADEPVLWPARIRPADRAGGAGCRHRPPPPASPRRRVARCGCGRPMTGRSSIAWTRRACRTP